MGIWGDGINGGNGYAFVGNVPVQGTDPKGLATRQRPPSVRGWMRQCPKKSPKYANKGEFVKHWPGLVPWGDPGSGTGFDYYPPYDDIMKWAYEGKWCCLTNRGMCRVGVESAAVTKYNLWKKTASGSEINVRESGGFAVVFFGTRYRESVEATRATTLSIPCPVWKGIKAITGEGRRIVVTVKWKRKQAIGLIPGLGPVSVDVGASVSGHSIEKVAIYGHRVFCCCYIRKCKQWQKGPVTVRKPYDPSKKE